MTTIELTDKLTDASRWFARASSMIGANEEHTCVITTFSKAAHAACTSGERVLGKLKRALNDEFATAEPRAELTIADELGRYVAAITNTVRFDVNKPEAHLPAECCFYLAGPEDEREVLSVGSGHSAAAAILAAFVDLVNNYALQDGKLVKREEEGDDDGE